MKRADLVQSCVVALGAVVCVFGTSRVVIAAETLVARLHPVSMEGSGVDPSKDLGTVSFSAGNTGAVVVDAQVKGLPPGKHGFHIHRDGSCGIGKVNDKDAPGGAAGPHFDPAATGKHLGPDGAGHAGDLPNLEVKSDGTGTLKASTTKIKPGGASQRSSSTTEAITAPSLKAGITYTTSAPELPASTMRVVHI